MQRAGERFGERGLACSRHILDQHVPITQHGRQEELDARTLPDDHLADRVETACDQPIQRVAVSEVHVSFGHASAAMVPAARREHQTFSSAQTCGCIPFVLYPAVGDARGKATRGLAPLVLPSGTNPRVSAELKEAW
jgi:hypothetical protein